MGSQLFITISDCFARLCESFFCFAIAEQASLAVIQTIYICTVVK